MVTPGEEAVKIFITKKKLQQLLIFLILTTDPSDSLLE